MMWARQVYDISPSAWEVVRKVLPLPSDRVLKSAFAQVRFAVSQALLDVNEVGTIVEFWMRSSPVIGFNTEIVLSVDAVAFRPRQMQTTREDSRGNLTFFVSKPRIRRIAQLRQEISCEEKRLQLLSEDRKRDFCTIAWKE
jgi:hypothetical protein